MDQLSYHRHHSPPPIIQHAIWLYLRFTLSYRDVEETRHVERFWQSAPRWNLKARDSGRAGRAPVGTNPPPCAVHAAGKRRRYLPRGMVFFPITKVGARLV